MRRASRLAWLLLVVGCVDLVPPGPVDGRPQDAREAGPWDADAQAEVADAGPEQASETAPDPDGGKEAPPGPPDALSEAGPPDVPPPLDTPLPPVDMGSEPPVPAPSGTPCAAGPQCASGTCVDGVCCATACTGTCEACNLLGQAGTCTPVPAGQDPSVECAKQPESSCQRAGGCNGSGACHLHPANTVCQAGSCTAGAETSTRVCNGLGTCGGQTIRSCGAYACNGATCASTCSLPAHCSSGNACWGGSCVGAGTLPVLAWRFDETTGSTALDASGNGLHGTYTGVQGTPSPSTVVPPLRFPNPHSRSFAISARQGVVIPLGPRLRPANNFTVMAWYRATKLDTDTATPGSDIVSGGDQYVLRLRPGELLFVKRLANASFMKCEAALGNHLDGQWHHAAAVSTPAGEKIYFDGVERGACAVGDDVVYDRGVELWVGRHAFNGSNLDFDGGVDEVRLYDRVLTPAEIAALAAGGN